MQYTVGCVSCKQAYNSINIYIYYSTVGSSSFFLSQRFDVSDQGIYKFVDVCIMYVHIYVHSRPSYVKCVRPGRAGPDLEIVECSYPEEMDTK